MMTHVTCEIVVSSCPTICGSARTTIEASANARTTANRTEWSRHEGDDRARARTGIAVASATRGRVAIRRAEEGGRLPAAQPRLGQRDAARRVAGNAVYGAAGKRRRAAQVEPAQRRAVGRQRGDGAEEHLVQRVAAAAHVAVDEVGVAAF